MTRGKCKSKNPATCKYHGQSANVTPLQSSIVALRNTGKSYREIEKILGCSKGTIAYYLSSGQREKSNARRQISRMNNPLARKVDSFQAIIKRNEIPQSKKSPAKSFTDRVYFFKELDKVDVRERTETPRFTAKDVVDKFGMHPKCYLTGEQLDFSDPSSYELDHVTPRASGGSNELDNMDVASPTANRAKGTMSVSSFVLFCKKVLENHGYTVTKN